MSIAMPYAGLHDGDAEATGPESDVDRKRCEDAASRVYLEQFWAWVEQIERATTAAALTDAYHHAPFGEHPPQ